jgi:outer membrane protein assembly factor BamE (lipoprotein component of BamABCDE complex)
LIIILKKRGERVLKNFLLVIAFVSYLSGCASVGHKIDTAAANKIEKGKTTREEVGMLLGSPDQVTRTGSGDTVYVYRYARVTAKPQSFIPIFGVLAGGANVQNQMVMVTFGPDNVVKNFISSQGGMESDTGMATGGKADMPEVEGGKRPK